MYELSLLFFRISLFRNGPQDVPASPWLLALLLPIYIVVNFLILWLNGTAASAPLQVAVDFAMMPGFIWPLLYFAGKSARFQQTLHAMLGTDIVIAVLALPVIASLNNAPNQPAYFALVGLMIWHWVINGHIFRHALDRSAMFGMLLALLYIMMSAQVMASLFPVLINSPE
ncbi:MAG: hypothetical protein KGZ80_09520 [Methylomonas sp.]|nr:hypothetical protein [Methylomonas sp.]PPD20080.1 MAG: hypothetical protein CTY23_10055 [Methylomonas sp.]PPD23330.1 MAG: hypothetical protein CTY22_12160 [Methylomonas sp.]PPD29722.1 MAG: hypothetical protein CTY21_12625 [Methylomonas sp.]PPD39612.1 MAG: hypothetical protein CTY17_07885 [Methylomonas sp.]